MSWDSIWRATARATIAIALWAAAGALFPGPVAAQEQPAATAGGGAAAAAEDALEPVGFVVERIVVEGARSTAMQSIVLSESRLEPGRTYTEPELRQAIYRVLRLPFVVAADLALRRGSERGAYELAIVVSPAKPVVFSADAAGVYSRDLRPFPGGDDDHFDGGLGGTVTGRAFVGRKGMVFGSLQGFDTQDFGQFLQAGFTRYGVIRPGGYLTLGLSTQINAKGEQAYLDGSAQLGVPIVGDHALRLDLGWGHSETDFEILDARFTVETETQQVGLAWIYDSTDDPLFASHGTRVTTSGTWTQAQTDQGPLPLAIDSESVGHWLQSEGRHYWSLTPRQSLALGGAVGYRSYDAELSGEYDLEQTNRWVLLELVHGLDLATFARNDGNDLRWENGILLDRNELEDTTGGFTDRVTRDTLRVRSSLLLRNAWCVVRLSLEFQDLLGEG